MNMTESLCLYRCSQCQRITCLKPKWRSIDWLTSLANAPSSSHRHMTCILQH